MKRILFLLAIAIFISCSKEKISNFEDEIGPEQIVVIAKNMPTKFGHYLSIDSLGGEVKNKKSAYRVYDKIGFSYVDSQNIVKLWNPKNKTVDTLTIPYFKDYLELSFDNPFTTLKESFLFKNGDTVVFDFKHKIPYATITNREVNDIELNYNRYRLKEVFNNKYSSSFLIFGSVMMHSDFQNADKYLIKYSKEAIKNAEIEERLLDSLNRIGVLSDFNHKYRLETLRTMINNITDNYKKLLNRKQNRTNEELFQETYSFDHTKNDSLLMYYSFRKYLRIKSRYNLKFIKEDYGTAGKKYIDSRVRFDSIVQDKRFNQSIRNFLLFEAYNEIVRDLRVKDKKEYFVKLQQETTNREELKRLAEYHNLDFNQSDKLLLSSLQGDSTSLQSVISKHKGEWLYIDIWASWCAPCRKTMPASKRLQKEFQNQNVSFIYLSLNDQKKNWKEAIIKDEIQEGEHYFVENGNTSKVVEDLNINTIPHYLIYNPKGELVHGYADRPGEGAKKLLNTFLNTDK